MEDGNRKCFVEFIFTRRIHRCVLIENHYPKTDILSHIKCELSQHLDNQLDNMKIAFPKELCFLLIFLLTSFYIVHYIYYIFSFRGSALQNKTTIPVHDISKAGSITHHQGNKNIQNATQAIVDEFKYGFPSDGLSRTSNKWWGSSTTDSKKDAHGKEDNKQSEKPVNDSPSKDKVDSQSGKDESNNLPELSGTGLLSAVRKRAVDEGREALKLGVHQFSGIKKPGKREQRLLLGIFGSSLPKEWWDGSS